MGISMGYYTYVRTFVSGTAILMKGVIFHKGGLSKGGLSEVVLLFMQLNITIMNPGYNELPDVTNIDLRMYTYLLYVNEP